MRFVSTLGPVALGVVLLQSPPADACGGCFHEASPTQTASVVTDHRMALSISPTQTVLWDQVRYQGDPVNFAWVLPVGQGAYVELARDEWLGALDALSAPTITAPALPSRCGGFGGGGGGGFGCGATSAAASPGYGSYGDAGASFDGGNGVQVISQEVVGPYLAVTIRSTDGQAISQWLLDNGFEIPTDIQPVLDAYTNEGFDFIALKLAPNQGVQAMQPVRVVTPGADPTLPLRMVAAGIGSSVGLTLYVVAEGRYETASFPSLLIDRKQVLWDGTAARSNYTDLFSQTVAAGGGWVTESSVSASQLQSVYKAACLNAPMVAVPCDVPDAGAGDASASGDASTDDASASGDASTDDASASGDAATEAGDDASTTATDGGGEASTDDASTTATDAGASDASTCVQYVSACSFFTDWDTAIDGANPYDLRITRLRTTLPASALTKDLTLAASSDQSTLPNTMTATGYTDPSYDPCPGAPVQQTKEGCGCDTAGQSDFVVSTSLAVVALLSLARRRRRARRDA